MGITHLAGSGKALANMPDSCRVGLERDNAQAVNLKSDFSDVCGLNGQSQGFDMNLGVA